MEEIWKPVPNYEGYYEVSNMGEVRSVDREVEYVRNRSVVIAKRRGKTLSQTKDKDGYMRVIISKGNNPKTPPVHRLVASAFLGTNKNKPVINHKNEKKDDNRLSNLEWCTVRYNNLYNEKSKKSAAKQYKPVTATDIKTGKQKRFKSISEAASEGFYQSHISSCCNGRRNHHLGYKWEFTKQEEYTHEQA